MVSLEAETPINSEPDNDAALHESTGAARGKSGVANEVRLKRQISSIKIQNGTPIKVIIIIEQSHTLYHSYFDIKSIRDYPRNFLSIDFFYTARFSEIHTIQD